MEGPSLVLLTEELKALRRSRVVRVSGERRKDFAGLKGQSLVRARSWGKHLLLYFSKDVLRVHFLMFGSYRVNERRERPAKLSLGLKGDELNLYSCAIKVVEPEELAGYDWSVDVMSEDFDVKQAVDRVRARSRSEVCDVLMDQSIFAGVGNIIKNEVFFRLRLHPSTKVGALSPAECRKLVRETKTYCQQFYEWKKINQLKRNWLIFRKRKCPVCGRAVVKRKTGALQRVSHFCPTDQPLRRA